MRSTESRKENVLEMKCLRSLAGTSRMDRGRNEEVQRRAGIKRKLVSRVDLRVLRWFGHVERMNEFRMARRVLLMTEVSGVWYRVDQGKVGRSMKVASRSRGMTVEAARQCEKDK